MPSVVLRTTPYSSINIKLFIKITIITGTRKIKSLLQSCCNTLFLNDYKSTLTLPVEPHLQLTTDIQAFIPKVEIYNNPMAHQNLTAGHIMCATGWEIIRFFQCLSIKTCTIYKLYLSLLKNS